MSGDAIPLIKSPVIKNSMEAKQTFHVQKPSEDFNMLKETLR